MAPMSIWIVAQIVSTQFLAYEILASCHIWGYIYYKMGSILYKSTNPLSPRFAIANSFGQSIKLLYQRTGENYKKLNKFIL